MAHSQPTAPSSDPSAGAVPASAGTEAAGAAGPAAATSGALGIAVTLALAHGINDIYASLLHPLLPRIMEKLGLSITLAAVLVTTLSLAASVAQPVFGYLADRFGRRPFVILGPLASGIFLSLIGTAPGLAVLLLLLGLGGLGSAAFHPPGASMATRASEGRGSGLRLSFFSFGGALGYAAGPLIAVGLVAWLGLGGLGFAMIPAILIAGALALFLPSDAPSDFAAAHATTEVKATEARPPSPRRIVRLLGGPLGLLFGISAVGAFVQRTFLTMEPIIVAASGGSEAAGALALSAYLGGQAVGTLSGGLLADRLDRRRLLVGLTLAALPAHLLALGLPPGSAPALAFAAVAGLLNMAALPPIVVMAQEIVPAGAAMGAGIVMGLAWATGAVGVLGAGVLGDLIGPRAAALAIMPVLLLATVLALRPSLRVHRRPPGG